MNLPSLEQLKQKYNYHLATPMMKQYLDAKFAHLDCFILFRMGDFYEIFYEDAVTCSRILGIALAKRGKTTSLNIPMCGVPYHALDIYLPKLIKLGYKVAICEQLETPEIAKQDRGYKAVVKREVVKIITPGTITDENLLNTKLPNYLAALLVDKNLCYIAYIDLSTFDFYITHITHEYFLTELEKIDPKEIIVSEKIKDNELIFSMLSPYRSKLVYHMESYFAYKKCKRSIEDFYSIQDIEAMGNFVNNQISIIGAILEYIRITQKESIQHISFPLYLNQSDYMTIDASTRTNLELVCGKDGKIKNSLLGVLDQTVTSIGSRALHQFITHPLSNISKIKERIGMTQILFNKIEITEKIRELLGFVSDIDRICSKISLKTVLPINLLSLSESLKLSDSIKAIIYQNFPNENNSLINYIKTHLLSMHEHCEEIDMNIMIQEDEDTGNTGYINPNIHPKLQELNEIISNGRLLLNKLEKKYINLTGINGLRILFNNVLGNFIEIKSKFADKVTDPKFIHRQTLTSVIRYTSLELQDLDNKINNAKNLKINLEQEIFNDLCQKILQHSKKIKTISKSLAWLDVFCGFAIAAKNNGYVYPEITDDSQYVVKEGRHPVIEKYLPSEMPFISNNCNLNKDNRLWLITGPNMSGKSTFLRQNALISIMAHIGSFVPASYAKIGVIDKMFSRIGASDDLSKGHSTFMVEMIETSRILAQSTEKSFIILDEVGRGTSTFDGVSIAWACLEHIHDKLRCRCLFASHYHELVAVSKFLPAMDNYTVKIDDTSSKILFLHKIIKGSANKSYGIHVAEIAGIPKKVITRAKSLLKKFESENIESSKQISDQESYNLSFQDLELGNNSSDIEDVLKIELDKINPDQLTPKDALEKLYHLKKIIS